MWLADLFPNGHRGLLAPTTRSPEADHQAGRARGVLAADQIPTYIARSERLGSPRLLPPAQLAGVAEGSLLRRGTNPGWDVIRAARAALKKVWSTERLFLQAHVSGYEESVMIAAYEGELLGAVSMRKREITPEGKTWAGTFPKFPTSS
jgi:hypothetical protein